MSELEDAVHDILQGGQLTQELRRYRQKDTVPEELRRRAEAHWTDTLRFGAGGPNLDVTFSPTLRVFPGDRVGTPRRPACRLAMAVYRLLEERLGGCLVFPAAGLDGELLEGNRITIGPYPSERPTHIAKDAEKLASRDELSVIAPGSEFNVMLKGLQSLLPDDEMSTFLRIVRPKFVIACGTSKPRTSRAVGYPYIDDDLRGLLGRLGFQDVTSAFLCPEEIALLKEAHEALGEFFQFGGDGGWFPLTQVEIYAATARREQT